MRLGREFALPEQWLRLATDAASADAPLAVLLVTEIAGGTCSVSGIHRGKSGFSAITSGITATWTDPAGADNFVDIVFPFFYTDEENGETHSWAPVGIASQVAASYVVISSATVIGGASNYTIRVQYLESTRLGPLTHVVVIYGTTEPKYAGDYGASSDKISSSFEGESPYAWQWLQEMRQVRGDAFSTAPGSFPEMENIALARHFGMVQRLAERHAASQTPEGSDQTLGRWAKILNIGTTTNRDWELRSVAAAKFALTIGGPTAAAITAAAQQVFRHNFVTIHRFVGDFDSPPVPTFWPAGVVGPGVLDIGNGVWSSVRYYYLIQLTAVSDSERARVYGVAKNTFDDLLRSALPPVNTWGYTFTAPGAGLMPGGFQIGRDSL